MSTTTKIVPPPAHLTASRQQLLDYIERLSTVQSMKAVVNFQLTVESEERDEEKAYRDVRGAIVTRRPEWIRTSAQSPGGLTTVFDMVSNGRNFQVHIPWKNRVYEGENAIDEPSEKRIENIRPQHILHALMFEPIGDDQEVFMDTETYGRSGFQVLHLVGTDESGARRILRNYWFSRENLTLARLRILDADAEVETDAWYREWLEDNGLPYPRYTQIRRPQDGYEIDVEMVRPGLNESIPDSSFVLSLPEGIQVERVGEPSDGELATHAGND